MQTVTHLGHRLLRLRLVKGEDLCKCRGSVESEEYRREQNGEALVWSVGRNEWDDDGDVSDDSLKDLGFRIRLNRISDLSRDDPVLEKVD